jgi:adenylate cyclase
MEDVSPEISRGDVAPAEVVHALGRVLDSRQFKRSPRARGFLAYVVTETLSGRGERLSERTIARRALHRDADFDGRADASVRVQAVRVRKQLEEYYTSDGIDDPLRIELPRGSYVPVFQRPARIAPAIDLVPGVVVLALTSSGEEPAGVVARTMADMLVQSLAPHAHIRVIGPVQAETDVRAAAAAGAVTTALSGHVRERGGRLTLAVRLHDAASSAVLWSQEESVDVADLAALDVEGRWSREIAARVGDVSGPVIRQELGRGPSVGAQPELAARLAFYAYLDDGSVASIHAATAKLDAALDAGCRTAPLLAMRGALANTSSLYEFADRDTELDRAEGLAREALVRDGGNIHAHLVLSYPLMQRGQVDLAVELVEAAARLAAYQPTYLSTAGMALIACGERQRGSALIREAIRLNPGLSGQTHGWLAFVHLADGDYERALAEAALLPSEGDYLWGPLFRALALSGLGYDEQATAEATRAREIRPDVMDDPGAHLDSVFRLTDEERSRLVALVPDVRPVVMPQQRDDAGLLVDPRI